MVLAGLVLLSTIKCCSVPPPPYGANMYLGVTGKFGGLVRSQTSVPKGGNFYHTSIKFFLVKQNCSIDPMVKC